MPDSTQQSVNLASRGVSICREDRRETQPNLPAAARTPLVPGEPTWCSSLGREGSGPKEVALAACANSYPVPSCPRWATAPADCGCGAGEGPPLSAPDHVTQLLGPTRAQLGREPSRGVRDRRGAGVAGLEGGAGCLGTPPPA